MIFFLLKHQPQSCYQAVGLSVMFLSLPLLPPVLTCGCELCQVTKEQPAGTKSPVAAGGAADTPAGITPCNPSQPPTLQGDDVTGWRSLSARRHPAEGGGSQKHSASDSLIFLFFPLMILCLGPKRRDYFVIFSPILREATHPKH